MPTQRPLISVITLHHTGALLFGFLESIFKSTDVTFEVIVMTSNKQLAMDGIKGCIVIHHDGMPAEKRNAANRIAKGKLLAFFDDDVEVDPLCLYHLKDMLQGSVAMSFGKLWNMEHRNRFDEAGGYLTWTGFIWSRAEQNEVDRGQYNTEDLILAGKSASCMVRKSYFDIVGGFDEDFGILGEETDLAWRLWLIGKSVVFCPQATGYHAFNTKFKPVEKFYTNERIFENGPRNYVAMLYKNLGTFNLIRILPIHIAIWLITSLMFIATCRVSCGILIMKGLLTNVKNIKSLHNKRRAIQRKRVGTDKTLFTHILRTPRLSYFLKRFFKYRSTGLHG